MGVGSTLERWFSWFGLKDDGRCHCTTRACLLDLRGPEWCEQRVDRIIRWLRRGAAKRRVPFNARIARIVIYWAISEAKRTQGSGIVK